jgi:glycosyltransferase involved in cell wall biosynthesis
MQTKIFVTGGEGINWAADADYEFARKALAQKHELVSSASEAEAIHAVNWASLLAIEPELLRAKFVSAMIPHDFSEMVGRPEYLKVAPYVDLWLSPSQKVQRACENFGLPSLYVPYPVGQDFKSSTDKQELRKKYNLPVAKYLIGSFQRDTEGRDLVSPKLVKGPDVFLEIVRLVAAEQPGKVHVVLAGPRRHWLLSQLKLAGIPYTYLGEEVAEDDIAKNISGKEQINELLNAIDLYLVASRKEGGPQAILEAVATGCKLLSSRVGISEDVLPQELIFDDVITASEIILGDLDATEPLKVVSKSKLAAHSAEAVAKLLVNIYHNTEAYKQQAAQGAQLKPITKYKPKPSLWQKLFKREQLTIFHKFMPPPWGGGNQFLLALKKQLEKFGLQVKTKLGSGFAIIFNSFTIDFDEIKKINPQQHLLIHRIDGPTSLGRGKDVELDDKLFELNSAIADISVFQSNWSLIETLKLGYRPVNPVLISNAPDPEIFNRAARTRKFMPGGKLRIIATSWSDNPRKGSSIYKWLDENLDFSKYEFTFVGRINEEFENIKHIPPVTSEELAKILQEHDAYITASENDACSNALIEALTCGLPAVYLKSGGHPELVGYAGLGFDKQQELPEIFAKIAANYQTFQNLLQPNKLEDISAKYLATSRIVE